jgi:hypothetical protein
MVPEARGWAVFGSETPDIRHIDIDYSDEKPVTSAPLDNTGERKFRKR